MSNVDYNKFSNRVCNLKEAGFIGIGFLIAVVGVGSILLGIYFGTKCGEGFSPCQDGYSCVENSKICDGFADCPVGDDEWRCHPTEFYVAFRTEEFYDNQNYNESTATCGATYDAQRDTLSATCHNYEDFMNKSLKANPLTEKGSAFVFRLRMVNSTGQDLNPNTTQADARLAVHGEIKFPPIGKVCDTATVPISTSNIKTTLNGTWNSALKAEFDAPGPGVTTGVAVILTAPEKVTCRRKKVYCTIECKAYQFSTKGCPSHPCVCWDEKDLGC
jgi:hypothetical protein